MAAIAKFISYDGGVAFSDRVIKIQKRDEDGVIIPLGEIVLVGVRRPKEDSEGYIRVDTASGKRYRLFFEDDQLREAVQFKKQFEAFVADPENGITLAQAPQKPAGAARPPRPEVSGGKAAREPAERRGKSGGKAAREPAGRRQPESKPLVTRWWFWLIIVALLAAIAGGVLLLLQWKKAPDAGPANDQPGIPAAVTEGAQLPEGDTQQTDGDAQLPADGAQQPVEAAEGVVTGSVGSYDIQIKDAFKAADYEGSEAIVITYNWTNNSESTSSAMVALIEKAFQDGVQLDPAILVGTEGYDGDASMTEIRPGVSLDVQAAYVLRSDSPVEFEVGEFLGLGAPVTKQFDPTAL